MKCGLKKLKASTECYSLSLRISAELVTSQMPAEGASRMIPIDFLLMGHFLRDV